jgi:hypothetical protein
VFFSVFRERLISGLYGVHPKKPASAERSTRKLYREGKILTDEKAGVPTALDNGQRSPRKRLAAVVRRLVLSLRR